MYTRILALIYANNFPVNLLLSAGICSSINSFFQYAITTSKLHLQKVSSVNYEATVNLKFYMVSVFRLF